MPRRHRLVLPGVPLHVIQRGMIGSHVSLLKMITSNS